MVIALAKPRVRSHQLSKDIGTQLRVSGFGHGKDERFKQQEAIIAPESRPRMKILG